MAKTIMEAKIFDSKFGKTCKINIELEIYINDNTLSITDEEVKELIENEERTDIGEMVLNKLHKGKVITK